MLHIIFPSCRFHKCARLWKVSDQRNLFTLLTFLVHNYQHIVRSSREHHFEKGWSRGILGLAIGIEFGGLGLRFEWKTKIPSKFWRWERNEAWKYSFVGKLSGSKRQNLEKKILVPSYNFKSKTVRLHVDLSDKTTQLFKTSSACKNLTIL